MSDSLKLGLQWWLFDAVDNAIEKRTIVKAIHSRMGFSGQAREFLKFTPRKLLDAVDCVLGTRLINQHYVDRLRDVLLDGGSAFQVNSRGTKLELAMLPPSRPWKSLSERFGVSQGLMSPSLQFELRQWLHLAVDEATCVKIMARLAVNIRYDSEWQKHLRRHHLLDTVDCVLDIGKFAHFGPEQMVARLRDLLLNEESVFQVTPEGKGLEPKVAPSTRAPRPVNEDRLGAALSGSTTPPMTIAWMHPWVRNAAEAMWNTGHRRPAVHAAASAISAETRRKLGVGRTRASDTQLMKQAFRPPSAGQRYLKVDDEGGTGAEQDAVRDLAIGCFTAIRNPAGHPDGPDWSEPRALEYLAALSALARWIDGASVTTS